MRFTKGFCRIPGLEVIASGGVCTTDEIKKLKAAGCGGAIIGKAIYEGKITLAEALFAAGEDL